MNVIILYALHTAFKAGHRNRDIDIASRIVALINGKPKTVISMNIYLFTNRSQNRLSPRMCP